MVPIFRRIWILMIQKNLQCHVTIRFIVIYVTILLRELAISISTYKQRDIMILNWRKMILKLKNINVTVVSHIDSNQGGIATSKSARITKRITMMTKWITK